MSDSNNSDGTQKPKKDLTSIFELPKESEFATTEISELSQSLAPASAGEVEPAPVFEFESLDDFSKANPVAELQNESPSLDLPLPELTAAPAPEANPSESSFHDGLADAAPVEAPPTSLAGIDPTKTAPMKEFYEHTPATKPVVAAGFPFSLLITGSLTPEEKEKLLDILEREKMGIDAKDIEIQFQSNRVLIPRISEYAGVLLVQALRSTQATMKLGPSDSIFATDDTRANADATVNTTFYYQNYSSDDSHPAEKLPVTAGASIPGLSLEEAPTIIDTLTVSSVVKTRIVEAVKSKEYQELVEALQKELKYKAYRKGASAVTHYSVELTPLTNRTEYRVSCTGTAIRFKQSNAANHVANAPHQIK